MCAMPCRVVSSIMSKRVERLAAVGPVARKYSARKLTIISAEPNSVKRKNLIDGVLALLAAPHADHEVHRQQHDLEEHEEQDQVLGHERADHARSRGSG